MKQKSFGLQWHITDKCDQRCKHCYIYAGNDKELSRDLPIDVLEKILDNYIDFCEKVNRVPIISVTGGDPLLYKNWQAFFLLLKEKNILSSVLGNPFHLDEKTVQFLKYCGCCNYQMSIDGLEDTHDSIRKKGSYNATMEKVKFLNEFGVTSTIMTTVSRLNYLEVPRIIDEVVKAGVKNYAFARYCPNPKDYASILNSDEYNTFLETVWQKFIEYKESGTRFALKDHLWTLFLYEKGYINIEEINNESNIILDGCHCGISHMTVLTDGSVYACRRCDSNIGNALKQSFYDIFFSEKMDEYRCYENFEACSKCKLLSFCRGCPAVSKCISGNFYSKDPQCWKKI